MSVMRKSMSLIIYGLILLLFQINIGGIDIIPGVLSYVLMQRGISKLHAYYNDASFKRLHSFSNFMVGTSLVVDIFGYIQLNRVESLWYLLVLVLMQVLQFVFIYRIIVSISEYARMRELQGVDLNSFIILGLSNLVLITVGVLLDTIEMLVFMVVYAFISKLYAIILLMRLRSQLNRLEEPLS